MGALSGNQKGKLEEKSGKGKNKIRSERGGAEARRCAPAARELGT